MPAAYPIALDLHDRRVVVVGGGDVAERKVRGLLDAGASVTVVAPACAAALREAAASGRLVLVARGFADDDLDGARLAFAATHDPATNARVVAAARARGILVDDASDGARGDFASALAHRCGSVTFTVDTGGASPSFALRLRDELAARFDARYGRAADTLRRARAYVTTVVPPPLRSATMRLLAAREIDELAAMNASVIENEVDETVAALAGPRNASAPPRSLVVATRASSLALWQTRHVVARLATRGIVTTILEVSTHGDRIQDKALDALGTDGVFVKELELALRDGRADYAVHSCKDLPSSLPDDMCLAAIGPREDPRDAFCSERYATLDQAPPGALIGTSSPRRRAQLAERFPHLRFENIRGNVDTRLRKLRDGQYDGIVLAMAGLNRLGLRATYVVPLSPAMTVPAVGQGALALECRASDAALATLLHEAFADERTELAVAAERAFLRELKAGCQAPIGAYAQWTDGAMLLSGAIGDLTGGRVERGIEARAIAGRAEAEAFGAELARRLATRREASPLAGHVFLLGRTQERPSQIAAALRGAGADVVEASDADEAVRALGGRTPDALLFPSSGSVTAVGPYLATLRERSPRPIVATMGEASSAAASEAGFAPDVVAPEPTIAAFVQTVTHRVLSGERP